MLCSNHYGPSVAEDHTWCAMVYGDYYITHDLTCWAEVHGDHYVTGTVPVAGIGWGSMLIRNDCYVTITVDCGSTNTIPHSLLVIVFTAWKRSLGQGTIFSSVCQEFCSQGRGLPQCMLGYHHPSHPPGDTVNERAVCILLECNLVMNKVSVLLKQTRKPVGLVQR